MEVRVLTQDKEISDDDDDRNHKHRKRDDTRLQSLEDDVFTKPYRSKPGSQSNETWKKYSFNPLENDKFDQKHPHFPRGPSEKSRGNQQFSVDPGLWSQPFSVDRHSVFANSNSHGPSWGPFGIPNGGLDWFRPAVNPCVNMGLGRQRCRDFEEQGFCLRGDMCPMEHGLNRIVVEDVQSLSQFNLPVSLATSNLSTPPAGTVPLPTTNNNNKIPHEKNIKHADSSSTGPAADFYDPDQPLWGNNNTPAGPQSDDSDHEVVPSTSFYAHGTIKKRTERVVRKPSQKAERTLFLNGIPEKSNKKEALISHFKRFGQVVNVYIPVNTERAFIQFSKREEAEAALMAPDAVMGNRFIKMWWANRDNVPYKRKDGSVSTLQNDVTAPVSEVNSTLQKKLESLEVLKEELRRKQEMLDQKRVDFRRKLDKLAKQATGVKGEMLPEQVTKKQKLPSSPPDDVAANSKQNSKTTLALKSSPVVTNRFKLDNRPTEFNILPPLPDGFTDVTVIKEHFLPYGEISKVEIDDNSDPQKGKPSAHVYFTTRHAAEKAFLNGKKWKGHNLQLTWLNFTSKNNSDSSSSKTDSQKPDVEMVKSEIEEESNKSWFN